MYGWWKIQFHRGYEGEGYILFIGSQPYGIYTADGTLVDRRIIEYTTVNSKSPPPPWEDTIQVLTSLEESSGS